MAKQLIIYFLCNLNGRAGTIARTQVSLLFVRVENCLTFYVPQN